MVLKVEGYDDLIRDAKSGAIVMADPTKYQEFMANYNAVTARKQQEQATTEQRFQKLEEGMANIEELLRQTLGAINARNQG